MGFDLIMPHNNSYCPNCGAPMEQDRFSSVCRYCGTVLAGKSTASVPQEHTDTGNPRRHYDYIATNEERIVQYRFVELQKEGKRYIITSKSFYANDGFLKHIPSLHWRLQFQCDGRTEQVLIGVSGKRPATRMSIKIGDNADVLTLRMLNYANGYTWFKLSEAQLLAICTTQTIDLSTDLPLPTNAQFNELPIFAARFYNTVFNRMKFMYSTHVNLISDCEDK